MARIVIRGLSVTLTVVMVAVLHAPTALGAFPGQNGKFIVSSGVLYQFNGLQVTDARGSQWLTQTQSRETEPAWSPDGGRVVWARDLQQLWIMSASGANQCEFFRDPDAGGYVQIDSPAWSPDATKVAFVRLNDLYVVPAPAAGTCPQTPEGMADATPLGVKGADPAWSPDGSTIAYTSSAGGVALVHPDGSGATRITSGAGDGEPDWSPDGSKLVIASGAIFTMAPVAGAQQTIVAPAQSRDACGAQWNDGPHWSPDGSMIAYRHVSCDDEGHITAREKAAKPDGTDLGEFAAGLNSWQPCFTDCHGLQPQTIVDSDQDGVPDNVDRCPSQPGPASNGGCPIVSPPTDSDGDGIPDAFDACPGQPGPSSNRGCPTGAPDADQDGVPDAVDACPDMRGPAANGGCPVGDGTVRPPVDPLAGADSDGDGLSDGAEARGVDVDGDGRADLDLAAMGAKVDHKDLFVELDAMPGHMLSGTALARVIGAFAAAPVSNPDGRGGITLHLDEGPGSLMDPPSATTWAARSQFDIVRHVTPLGTAPGGVYEWNQFDSIKRESAARRSVFRYAISADRQPGTSSSGIARGIPGHDFLITLGSACGATLECSGTEMEQAGTLIHELGHTLGLRHGGNDDDNDKPDYHSSMNYLFQMSLVDYSHGSPWLDWAHLDFRGGLAGAGRALPAATRTAETASIQTLVRYASRRSGDRRAPNLQLRRRSARRLRVVARDDRRLDSVTLVVDGRPHRIAAKGRELARTVQVSRNARRAVAVALDATGNRSKVRAVSLRRRHG